MRSSKIDAPNQSCSVFHETAEATHVTPPIQDLFDMLLRQATQRNNGLMPRGPWPSTDFRKRHDGTRSNTPIITGTGAQRIPLRRQGKRACTLDVCLASFRKFVPSRRGNVRKRAGEKKFSQPLRFHCSVDRCQGRCVIKAVRCVVCGSSNRLCKVVPVRAGAVYLMQLSASSVPCCHLSCFV